MKNNTRTTHAIFFKKIFIACCSVILLSMPVIAQNIQWAKTTVSGYANVNDVIADAAGNTYILGDFAGTVNFGSSFSLTSGGSFDGYLCKRDPSGNILWLTRIVTGLNEDRAQAMSMFGNYIYIGGHFSSTTA